ADPHSELPLPSRPTVASNDVCRTRSIGKTGTLLPIMSFIAAAFQLSDAQVAQLPNSIIGKATSAFSRHQLGKFGFGERYRFTTRGPERFAAARDQWSQLTNASATKLAASLKPSAPICFAAFTFDARSAVDSVMIVPKFVLDRRRDGTWLRYIYCTETVAPSADEIFSTFVEQLPDEPAVAAETQLTTVSA